MVVSEPSKVPTAAVTSGFLREIAGVGHEIARGEIIRAVGDDVVARDQIERVAGVEPRHMRFDRAHAD